MASPEQIIQHKGLHQEKPVAPNSLESILSNYRGNIESDAILLDDGNIVMVQERDLGLKLTDLEQMTMSELERLYKGKYKQALPLLKESVGLSSDALRQLFLEIKASDQDRAKRLGSKIIEIISDMDQSAAFKDDPSFIENKVNFQSFSAETLKQIKLQAKAQGKDIKTGLFWPSDEKWAKVPPLFDQTLVDKITNKTASWHEMGIIVAKDHNIDLIEYQPFVIDKELVDKVHAHGLKIGASVTNDETLVKHLIEMDVDYIKTEL